MKNSLLDYVGTGGHVSDKEFTEITELLEDAVLVEEEEASGIVVSHYVPNKLSEGMAVKEGIKDIFVLWYQVRTPTSPKDQDYAFGFDILRRSRNNNKR